jgi:hypothetical protein
MEDTKKDEHPLKEYDGIENALKYLMKEIGIIRQEIIDIKTKMDLKTYSLKEIAQGIGYSPQTMRNKPWKIPTFGKPDEGVNPGKWFYNTIVEWYAIPEDERRFQWESLSSNERLKILGKIKTYKKVV